MIEYSLEYPSADHKFRKNEFKPSKPLGEGKIGEE